MECGGISALQGVNIQRGSTKDFAPENFAIKIIERGVPEDIDPETGLDPDTKREIETQKLCNHQAIVHIEEYGLVPGAKNYQPYIVMEFAEGKTLRGMLESGRTFSVDDMLKVADQLCKGLQHLHELGAVHRDIKPENFILSEKLKVKIVDLGLAKTQEERDRLTALSVAASGFKGTGGYAPPWQMCATEIDPSFDQYATAICLAEMLAGTHPFELPPSYRGGILAANKVLFQQFIPLTNYRQDLPEPLYRYFEQYFKASSARDVYPSMNELYRTLEEAAKGS